MAAAIAQSKAANSLLLVHCCYYLVRGFRSWSWVLLYSYHLVEKDCFAHTAFTLMHASLVVCVLVSLPSVSVSLSLSLSLSHTHTLCLSHCYGLVFDCHIQLFIRHVAKQSKLSLSSLA